MTIQEKKEWLGRYRSGLARIEQLRERRARVQSAGEKITVSYSKTPGGGSGGDKIQLAVEHIAEIDAEIKELQKELPKWKKAANKAIEKIANADHRRLMQYYYVECLPSALAARTAGYQPRYAREIRTRIIGKMKITPPTASPRRPPVCDILSLK